MPSTARSAPPATGYRATASATVLLRLNRMNPSHPSCHTAAIRVVQVATPQPHAKEQRAVAHSQPRETTMGRLRVSLNPENESCSASPPGIRVPAPSQEAPLGSRAGPAARPSVTLSPGRALAC